MVEFLKDENFENSKELIVGLPPYMRRLYLALGHLYQLRLDSANLELINLKDMIKDETKAWIIDIRNIAEQMIELIKTGDENEVVIYLQNIIRNTISNLKIKKK